MTIVLRFDHHDISGGQATVAVSIWNCIIASLPGKMWMYPAYLNEHA